MIIVIVSDTHNDIGFISNIVKMYPNAVKYIHAGDSCLYEFQLDPFISVKGNCDYYIKNRIRIIEVKDLKILLLHGEYHPLDNGYILASLAKENGCNIIVHGHTHRAKYEFVDGVHIICPGSPVVPRGGNKTFAIIEFNSFDDLKVEFIDYGY